MQLETFLKNNNYDFSFDPIVRDSYKKDASVFQMLPSIIIYPRSSIEISLLVTFVSDLKNSGENISVTAAGAMTDMTGGPLTSSVLLDMKKYLNKITEVNSNYIYVESGAYFRDVELKTKEYGWVIPSYPASKDLVTIGGMVSNNSGGELSYKYGQTRNYVEEVEIVLYDGQITTFKAEQYSAFAQTADSQTGSVPKIKSKIKQLLTESSSVISRNIIHTSKNSSGYSLDKICDSSAGTFNLSKLITGSQGTLGIITKVMLKGVTLKSHRQIIAINLKSLSNITPLLNLLDKNNAETIESYDDKTFKLGIKMFPSLLKQMGLSFIPFVLSYIPDLVMVIKYGMPKIIIIAEFDSDSKSELERNVQSCLTELKNSQYICRRTVSEIDRNKYWKLRRESFNVLRHNLLGLVTMPLFEDLIVPREHVSSLLSDIDRSMQNINAIYTIAGHAGDGNFHVIPLIKKGDLVSRDKLYDAMVSLYKKVGQYKGSISAEHNDGLLRTPYLDSIYDTPMLNIFVQVKDIFDPLNIFNPNKKVGCSITYAKSNLQ